MMCKRYRYGSRPVAFAVSTMLKITALAWAPPGVFANSQFFRPITKGLIQSCRFGCPLVILSEAQRSRRIRSPQSVFQRRNRAGFACGKLHSFRMRRADCPRYRAYGTGSASQFPGVFHTVKGGRRKASPTGENPDGWEPSLQAGSNRGAA